LNSCGVPALVVVSPYPQLHWGLSTLNASGVLQNHPVGYKYPTLIISKYKIRDEDCMVKKRFTADLRQNTDKLTADLKQKHICAEKF
jgi:hypothetical protein